MGLAIHHSPDLSGLPVPGDGLGSHSFSAFVDDLAIFLEASRQLPAALQIVQQFSALYVLHAQPAKSKLIFLYRAIRLVGFHGISVLQAGETTRYLGYEIGTGDLQHRNWALRIRRLQRRLLTASQISTSVASRVLILNAVILPSILFTAAVFEIPSWASKDIQNLYKQFLWDHSTSTDARRHKINPGLLYTPKKAGGVGLASVEVAIKTQRTKHALRWLTQSHDTYFNAWRSWAYQGGSTGSGMVMHTL